MKPIFTLAALIFCVYISSGQELSSSVCGKKWFAEKVQSVDGTVEKAGKEMNGIYTLLRCDGSFESVNTDKVIVTGNWHYDEASKAILLTVKNRPEEVMPVVSSTGTNLVVKRKNSTGDYITYYMGLR